jgi:hypothetical protein
MTGRERCSWADDGRHRYRFAVSRMAGTPYYGCGPSCAIVLPTGDGVVEDVAYLAPDVLVTSCAACDVEGEVGTTILVTDDDTALCRRCEADPRTALTLVERYGARCDGCGDLDDVEPWELPHDVAAYLCLGCSPYEADADADLVAPCGHVDPLGFFSGTSCRSCADRGAREVVRP